MSTLEHTMIDESWTVGRYPRPGVSVELVPAPGQGRSYRVTVFQAGPDRNYSRRTLGGVWAADTEVRRLCQIQKSLAPGLRELRVMIGPGGSRWLGRVAPMFLTDDPYLVVLALDDLCPCGRHGRLVRAHVEDVRPLTALELLARVPVKLARGRET